jgi:Mn-dependent DtxR family transcriptional regulator
MAGQHNFEKGYSGEDYLAAIYAICRAEGSAQQINIVVFMGFRTPSITRGVNLLAQKGLVTIIRGTNRKDICLTEIGRALGEKLHRRRQTITAFLEFLGLSGYDAAAEAHLWEHRISHETVDAMESVLLRAETRDSHESFVAAPTSSAPS